MVVGGVKWRSHEAEEYFAALQAQIAAVMHLPYPGVAQRLVDADRSNEIRRRFEMTEALRAEAVRIYSLFTVPVMTMMIEEWSASMTDLKVLAEAKKAAEAKFEAACMDRTISEAEYNRLRSEYEAAMKAHHDALGFGQK